MAKLEAFIGGMKEAKERGLSEEQRLSLGTRCMHFGEVLTAPQLARFRRAETPEGAVEVSEALVRACATAAFKQDAGDIGFDLDDVERIASKLWEEMEGYRL
jgi:hypothetical protein